MVATYTITVPPATVASYTVTVPASSEAQYNVLFILMDDVGVDILEAYDDINPFPASPSPQSQELYPAMPNLQLLVDAGVRFRRAYAQPVCSPTRATWLTGMYPFRHGVGTVIEPARVGALEEFGDAGYVHTTLVSRLQTAGYQCGIMGKWHLALPTVAMDPVDGDNAWQGWDHIPDVGLWDDWQCAFKNLGNYPTPVSPADGSYYEHTINRNGTETDSLESVGGQGYINEPGNYATTIQFDDALVFCNTAVEPFFCYLPLSSAHNPFDLPPQALTSTASYFVSPTIGKSFRAKCEAIDAELGTMIAGFDADRLARTMIIFAGDNGTDRLAMSSARDDDGKVLGGTYDALIDASAAHFKASVFERGVQIPLIIKGPLVSNGGRATDALFDAADIYPTILNMLGLTVPSGLDGISALPVLNDTASGFDTHERQFGFNETFYPNGDWTTISAPGTTTNYVRRQYTKRIAGLGTLKLVRIMDGTFTAETDFFYQLRNDSNIDIDPFEQVDLINDKAWLDSYIELAGDLDALLGTGTGGFELPITDEDAAAATVVTNSNGDLPITDELGVSGTVDVTGTSVDITDESGKPATVILTGV